MKIRPGVVIDYDVEGIVLGIEMLDVSERVEADAIMTISADF